MSRDDFLGRLIRRKIIKEMKASSIKKKRKKIERTIDRMPIMDKVRLFNFIANKQASQEESLTPEQEQEVAWFLTNNKDITDDKFHRFAESIGASPHKAEEIAYKLIENAYQGAEKSAADKDEEERPKKRKAGYLETLPDASDHAKAYYGSSIPKYLSMAAAGSVLGRPSSYMQDMERSLGGRFKAFKAMRRSMGLNKKDVRHVESHPRGTRFLKFVGDGEGLEPEELGPGLMYDAKETRGRLKFVADAYERAARSSGTSQKPEVRETVEQIREMKKREPSKSPKYISTRGLSHSGSAGASGGDLDIAAHELGHAKGTGRIREAYLPGMLATGVGQALAAAGPRATLGAAPWITAAGAIPYLAEEARASYHGLKGLNQMTKDLKMPKSKRLGTMAAATGRMGLAYGTYLANAASNVAYAKMLADARKRKIEEIEGQDKEAGVTDISTQDQVREGLLHKIRMAAKRGRRYLVDTVSGLQRAPREMALKQVGPVAAGVTAGLARHAGAEPPTSRALGAFVGGEAASAAGSVAAKARKAETILPASEQTAHGSRVHSMKRIRGVERLPFRMPEETLKKTSHMKLADQAEGPPTQLPNAVPGYREEGKPVYDEDPNEKYLQVGDVLLPFGTGAYTAATGRDSRYRKAMKGGVLYDALHGAYKGTQPTIIPKTDSSPAKVLPPIGPTAGGIGGAAMGVVLSPLTAISHGLGRGAGHIYRGLFGKSASATNILRAGFASKLASRMR
jgi:hypothetical protein